METIELETNNGVRSLFTDPLLEPENHAMRRRYVDELSMPSIRALNLERMQNKKPVDLIAGRNKSIMVVVRNSFNSAGGVIPKSGSIVLP